MKKLIVIVFSLIIMLILGLFAYSFPDSYSVYNKYSFNDYVFYNPITGDTCNENDYWTPYNNSNCFRFIVLTTEDTETEPNLRIMLDHDYAYNTYNNINSVLLDVKNKWHNYNSSVDIADEDTIYKLLKLENKPTIDNKITRSINGFIISKMGLYISYYNNGNYIDNKGYWLKDSFNDSLAYTVNKDVRNELVNKNEVRGIRPVITVSKSKLTKSSNEIDIANNIKNGVRYKYKFKNQTYNGVIYKHMQGFTIAKDTLVFYSSHSQTPDNGLMFAYNGTEYSNEVAVVNVSQGHGNAMSYDSKRDFIILPCPKKVRSLCIYNSKNIEYIKKLDIPTDYLYIKMHAIGYDDINDNYIIRSDYTIYIIDAESFNNGQFKIIYSFDYDSLYGLQDIEYKDGYLYSVDLDDSAYDRYSFHNQRYYNVINVINVKLDANGNPTKDFGKKVKEYGASFNDELGELEDIAFTTDKAVLGYAKSNASDGYTYNFYEIDYSIIAVEKGNNSATNSSQITNNNATEHTTDSNNSTSGEEVKSIEEEKKDETSSKVQIESNSKADVNVSKNTENNNSNNTIYVSFLLVSCTIIAASLARYLYILKKKSL